MLKNLETDKNVGLAEWQNSVGVELVNSAKKKELSEYDYLIKNLKADRFSAYQREAFNCFQESRRLGSAKGAFNAGICYEQGVGTSQNLEKVLRN
jgi:TPR repeat protein